MLRNTINVLAIVLVLGSSGLSTSAFARGGGSERDGFRGNSLSDLGHATREGDGGHDNRANGFPRYGGRDVWGHWGAYYGPMVPTL